MKASTILLTFCALAVASASGGESQDHDDVKKECIAKTGADEKVLQALWSGKDVVVDHKTKCFSACYSKATDMMEADGTINVEKAKAAIPSNVPNREKLIARMDGCFKNKGDGDECETAHNMAMCMTKKDK